MSERLKSEDWKSRCWTESATERRQISGGLPFRHWSWRPWRRRWTSAGRSTPAAAPTPSSRSDRIPERNERKVRNLSRTLRPSSFLDLANSFKNVRLPFQLANCELPDSTEKCYQTVNFSMLFFLFTQCPLSKQHFCLIATLKN